ncbi:hypothetical protein U1Q18_032711 [Sarracenia purpurea var. burkii]
MESQTSYLGDFGVLCSGGLRSAHGKDDLVEGETEVSGETEVVAERSHGDGVWYLGHLRDFRTSYLRSSHGAIVY